MTTTEQAEIENAAYASDAERIRADYLTKLAVHQGKFAEVATLEDYCRQVWCVSVSIAPPRPVAQAE